MTTSTLEPCTSTCSNYKQRPQVQASSIGYLQLRFLDYHKTGKNEIKRLFNLTSILGEEMANLREETEGMNINLK